LQPATILHWPAAQSPDRFVEGIKTRKPTGRIEVRESRVHGLGVYARQFVSAGTRIIEYTGQRLSWEDAPNDDSNPHTFNFGLESGDVINAELGGNDARWLNHSCDPNCEAIEEDDRIFIYALRDIEPGEELFYDYAMEIDEPITEESKKKFVCYCGSSSCRGTMLELKLKKKTRARSRQI
jgi:SET domain-containing protein